MAMWGSEAYSRTLFVSSQIEQDHLELYLRIIHPLVMLIVCTDLLLPLCCRPQGS